MQTVRRARISLAVGALLMFVGLAPALGQAPRQFTLATVNNMNHLPEFVGVEKGIFVKHGIDLKLKVLNSGAEVMRAFQGGDAQFITMSPTTMAAAELEQRALLAVGRIKQPVDFAQGLNMLFVEKAIRAAPQFFVDLKPVR